MHTMSGALPPSDLLGDHKAAEAALPFDPQDWDGFRALAHRMVEDMLWNLKTVRDRPVWQAVPEKVRDRLSVSVPKEGVGVEEAYEEFKRDVLPYPVGNTHPRFWGWVIGSGTPLGVMAEMLAATMNPNVSGLQGSPRYVETQVLGWLRGMLGYPEKGVGEGSGLLVSGGSMANLVALTVALQAKAGFDVGRLGLAQAPRRPVLYASDQTHFSIAKSVRMLGLGLDALRIIPVDADYRIDMDALEAAIRADRAAGLHPFCIVGTAGTVNTGAFDPLETLAGLAAREDLWLHVDGAFGAFSALVPELAPLNAGMSRADSLACDPHKWMVVPIEAGAVLFRNGDAHRTAFAIGDAGYVSHVPGGIGKDSIEFAEQGPQLTRGFRALKLWLSLKAYGSGAYADLVRMNVAQARHLAELVRTNPELELLAPVPLNVVNYRYVSPDLSHEALNGINELILVALQEQGIAAPSHTRLKGRFSLRVCITNHRTRMEDLDLLIRETIRLGRDYAVSSR